MGELDAGRVGSGPMGMVIMGGASDTR